MTLRKTLAELDAECDEEEKAMIKVFDSAVKLLDVKIIPKLMKTSVLLAHFVDSQTGLAAMKGLWVQVPEEEFREDMPNVAEYVDTLTGMMMTRIEITAAEIDRRIPTVVPKSEQT
jgi:hypothetical protein